MKAVQALASYCPYTKIKSLNLIAALKTNLANPAHERDKEGTDVRSASNLGPVPGQQRKVTGVIERKMWPIEGLFEVGENMGKEEINRLLDAEEEKEKKRRVSAPYNASVDITDIDWQERSQKLCNVHQQLLRIFNIHQAIYMAKCEQESRVMEIKKQAVHEELIRHETRLALTEAMENERCRKESLIREMAKGKGEHLSEFAETNSRLSEVHDELTESFQLIWAMRAQREKEQEMIQDQARRFERRRLSAEVEDIERQRRILAHKSEVTSPAYQVAKSKMSGVQNELVHYYGGSLQSRGVEKDATAADEIESIYDNKLRVANIEIVKCLMASEQERRRNCILTEEEMAVKMQIVEMLFAVHREIRERF